jgi:pilus assembly protein CpaD
MIASRHYATPATSLRTLVSRAALVACLAAAAGGCNLRTVSEPYPNDYRQRHPIAITEGARKVEVFIGRARGGLAPAQRADVTAFAHTWAREATGGMVIEVPTGSSNARAAHDAVREIRSLLSATGVPPQAVRVVSYQTASPAQLATIRMTYPKMTARVGPCGLWPHDLGPAFERNYNENRQYWNFGCANQRALAAMVEDPTDLVQPRGETPIYAARRNVVLDKYRKGESTATAQPNPNQGKISSVGQ